jgi:hypothetical protein
MNIEFLDSKLQRERRERGYTLLEYCAGAAIITGILWGSLSYLGNSMENLLRGVGDWAQSRATEIRTTTGQQQ